MVVRNNLSGLSMGWYIYDLGMADVASSLRSLHAVTAIWAALGLLEVTIEGWRARSDRENRFINSMIRFPNECHSSYSCARSWTW